MMMPNHQELIYDGKIVRLNIENVMLPNGVEATFEVVRHPGSVAIVPIENGTVYLVRQYRHPAGGYLLEIPAGTLDEEGESPEACASRELVEEIGRVPGRLTHLSRIFTAPGFCDEAIDLYLAEDLEPAEQDLERDEVLEVELLPFLEALNAIRDGRIVDAKSICGLMYVASFLGAGA